MPNIEFTERFDRAFARLSSSLQVKVTKAIELLAKDPRHPSLRSKRIQSSPGIFEARVDKTIRMTYQRAENDTLLMRNVGRHDETLRNP